MRRSVRSKVLHVACWLSLVVGAPGMLLSSDLKSDEQVILFPTLGQLSADARHWNVSVHGWVFEPEENSRSRRLLKRRIAQAIGITDQQDVNQLFDERVSWFLVDNERGKELTLQTAGSDFQMPRSAVDGHFTTSIELPLEAAPADGAFRTVMAHIGAGDGRKFATRLHLVPPRGVSVISDIDDTVKISHVTETRQLLSQTFLKPFQAVDGMAERYRGWQSQGATFHFVSGSPWQLYPSLSRFLADERFPAATFHLKRVRLKDRSILKLFEDQYESKLRTISELLQAYPQRQFLLVGDAGEQDPEVYGEIARLFPAQVRAIYIRRLGDEQRDSERMQQAFRELPASRWQLFGNGQDLPAAL